MRVLRRRQEERGAVAVLVGLLALVLFGMSAFVIDLGVAYTSTRQLQTAADSGVLAAAKLYSQQFGTCDELTSNSVDRAASNADLKAAAQAIADDYRERNRPGSIGGNLVVSCDPNHRLRVRYTVTGDTDTYFAPLLGGGSTITTERRASAVVEPPLVRMRPMAICSSYLPADRKVGSVFKAYSPGTGQAREPLCLAQSGNSWTLDCPEEVKSVRELDWSTPHNQINTHLDQQVLQGCQFPIAVVPGQSSKTGPALSGHLASNCTTAAAFNSPATCLMADPGNATAGKVVLSWQELIKQSVTFSLPVFCGPRPAPEAPSCPATETGDSVDGNGNNAKYPVHQIAVVNLCGYHFGRNLRYVKPGPSLGWCSEAVAEMSKITNPPVGEEDDWYMLFVLRHLEIYDAPVSGCPQGKTCTGIPRVWLSE